MVDRKFRKKGITESDAPSLFDPLVANYLDEIIKDSHSSFVGEKISQIINHIQDVPDAFSSLNQNKEIRKKFTEVFVLLLKNNDITNVKEFLQEPISELVNFFSVKPELQEIAIKYLSSFINKQGIIKKSEINDFLKHIQEIVLKCNVSSINGSFKKLKEEINYSLDRNNHNKDLEAFFYKLLNNELNPLMSKEGVVKIFKKDESKAKTVRDVMDMQDILLNIFIKLNDPKSLKKSSKLFELFIKEAKRPEILEMLREHEAFSDKMVSMLLFFLKNNDMVDIYFLLNSPLAEFIENQDRITEKDIIKHLEFVINKDLNSKDFNILISYI